MKTLHYLTVIVLLAVLPSLSALPCLGQSSTSSTQIVYKAPSLSLKMLDKDNKELTHINVGKDVYVFVDTFFRSYDVYFKDADGELSVMKYRFLKVEDTKTNMLRVQDDHNNILYITDLLKGAGSMLIVPAKARPDGMIGVFQLKGAERTTLIE